MNQGNPVQMAVMIFRVTANECSKFDSRQSELADLLNDAIARMQRAGDVETVLSEVIIGCNAIISVLPGGCEWQDEMLRMANLLFGGVSDALYDACGRTVAKARYGDPVTRNIREAVADQDSPVEVARNESTSPDKLASLSSEGDWRVRAAVANNQNTPESILEVLAEDSDEGVRAYAARNPRLPGHSMSELLSDSSEYVRDYLAQNVALPEHLMVALARDAHWRPRSGVAENPNALRTILEELVGDQDPRVSSIAEKRLNCN